MKPMVSQSKLDVKPAYVYNSRCGCSRKKPIREKMALMFFGVGGGGSGGEYGWVLEHVLQSCRKFLGNLSEFYRNRGCVRDLQSGITYYTATQ